MLSTSKRGTGTVVALCALGAGLAAFQFSEQQPANQDDPGASGPLRGAPMDGQRVVSHDSDPSPAPTAPTSAHVGQRLSEFLRGSGGEEPQPDPDGDTQLTDEEVERYAAKASAHQELTRIWETEEEDTKWTSQVEKSVASIIERDALRCELIDVACRETQCRVQVRVDSPEDGRRLAELSGLGSDQESVRFTLEDNQLHAEAFLAR